MAKKKSKLMYQPMRVQVSKGSLAEKQYYNSALPSGVWAMPKAVAPGVSPAPLDDLIFHGGKIVAQMEFQNIFLGSTADWAQSDITSINTASTLAMRDKRLNNVMVQYFHNSTMSCDARPLLVLDDPKPTTLGETDVQNKIVALFDAGKINKSDLDATIFNLILPPGAVLTLDSSSSLAGLGGYHGSVHVKRGGATVTLYYSANVFSQMLSPTRRNGIVAFNADWKNVVATLYHEMNEFRTDADVNDAIQSGDDHFLGFMSREGEEVGDQPIRTADSLNLVFKEVAASSGKKKRLPVQFLFSNAVHGAEGPIAQPHA